MHQGNTQSYEANDNINNNNNTQSKKHKETETEDKRQLPTARNKRNGKKDIGENRENTKNKINQRTEQSNEIKMKKTRQSKKVKNSLANFKVFYQNVRGLKSKVDSLMETTSNYQSMLICLVEAHLQKEE